MDELDTEVTQPEQFDEAPEVSNEAPAQEAAPQETMLEAINIGLDKPEETEAEKQERQRDEQGRFAKKQEEAAKEEAKPDDEMAMPDGLSNKAQRRFQTLVSKVHEANAELDQTRQRLTQFQSAIRDTGATSEEFGQALEYLRSVKSGNLDNALKIVDDQRRQIALALGRPLAGADPLSQFPDLRQRVDAYQMDEAAAIEIARSRAFAQSQHAQQQEQYQSQQRVQQHEEARINAVKQIDQMGVQWGRTDPDYAYKEKIIMGQLDQIAQKFPPNMWPQQIGLLYQTLSAMPAPVAAQPAARHAPLRSSGQTAGARAPSSMMDAISAGLGYGA